MTGIMWTLLDKIAQIQYAQEELQQFWHGLADDLVQSEKLTSTKKHNDET